MVGSAANYGRSWDMFWQDVAETTGEVFWDTAPSEAVERELPFFESSVDAKLPLIDVGCGTGRQTLVLAQRFRRVIGLDISTEAIRGARTLYARDNLEFRVFDMLEPGAGAALHDEVGDTNVYVRAVLHQLRAPDRAMAVHTLAALLGRSGRAFVVELAPAAEALFRSLASDPTGVPPKLARVFQHGIVPAALALDEVPALFAAEGLQAIVSASSSIVTTQEGPSGSAIEVPCDAWLFGRA